MGDYVHLFADETERTQYERSAQYNEPYISATNDTFDAEYNKRQDKQYAVKYTDLENNMHDFTYVEYDAEIEYLEATGTQYINTGFKPNQDTRIIAIMKCVTSNDYGRLFGAGKHNTKNSIMIDYEKGATGNLCIKYGTATAWTKVTSITGDYNIHTYDYNKNIVYRDSVKVSQATYTAFQCTSNLGIFTYINGNDVGQSTEFFKGRCYGFKIYDNNVLAMDLIPVRVGNTGYMYDKISCQLLGNSGSGNFVIGQDKYDAEIQYLESTGTQHIETEFKHNQNTRFVGKFEVINVAAITSAWLSPFGSWGDVQASSGTNYGKMKGIENNPNNNTWRSYYAKISNSLAFNAAVKRYGLHTIDFNKNVHTMDGYTCNHTAATFTSIYNDTIFGCRSYTGAVSHGYYKFYYFQIYDNGTLVRDYIPVRKNNIGYMYDRVSGQLFGNAGSGQFVLGPDI